jgi:hypothetical protein
MLDRVLDDVFSGMALVTGIALVVALSPFWVPFMVIGFVARTVFRFEFNNWFDDDHY